MPDGTVLALLIGIGVAYGLVAMAVARIVARALDREKRRLDLRTLITAVALVACWPVVLLVEMARRWR